MEFVIGAWKIKRWNKSSLHAQNVLKSPYRFYTYNKNLNKREWEKKWTKKIDEPVKYS
jgi:hypothetical protein